MTRPLAEQIWTFFWNIYKAGQCLANEPCKVLHCAHQLAYIAHFVIVPAYYAYQLGVACILYPSLGSIKQAAERAANDIGTYYFVFGVAKAFVGSSLHGGIQFILGGAFAYDGGKLRK